jgi:hypothetical protein
LEPLSRIGRVQRALIRAVQAVILPVLLTLVYVVGLGLTWLGALAFAPHRLLGLGRKPAESYWLPADGYGDANAKALSRPS